MDEQGFGMLGETLREGNEYNRAGMQIGNVDPRYRRSIDDPPRRNLMAKYNRTGDRDFRSVPYPADPSQGFHKFTLSWFPDTCNGAVNPARATEYHFDGVRLDAPTRNFATHPSRIVLNHWTNADKFWTAGPPVTDAVIIVKKSVAYYDKPSKIGEGVCPIRDVCDPSIACKVTL